MFPASIFLVLAKLSGCQWQWRKKHIIEAYLGEPINHDQHAQTSFNSGCLSDTHDLSDAKEVKNP